MKGLLLVCLVVILADLALSCFCPACQGTICMGYENGKFGCICTNQAVGKRSLGDFVRKIRKKSKVIFQHLEAPLKLRKKSKWHIKV